MSDTVPAKVPAWFWIVAVLALLWELMGIASYMHHVSMTAADVARLTPGEQRMHAMMPPWVTAAFAIAVFSGALGAITLLLRRRWALLLFVISLVAAVCQFGWAFLVAKAHQVVGPHAALLPAVIIGIALLLVWFASFAGKRGWLR